MKKILLLIGILTLGIVASAYAAKLEAPHNQTNAIACADCHVFGNFPEDQDCLSCHINVSGAGYSKTNAPKVLTHSSANTSNKYGTWSLLCKNCHRPHSNLQLATYGSQTYLVTGTITKVTRNVTLNTVIYDYNNSTLLKPEWDFTKWNRKSANASSGNERGLILFPNVANLALSAEIISATGTTVTVRGYPGTVAVGSTFAIIYGQNIETSAGELPVKFFNNTGQNSFAYDESSTGTDPTPDGICQVCHTQTTAWKADGTLSGVGVHAGLNGANCISCHKHEEGFAADCAGCHGFPPVNATAGGPNGLVNSPAATGSATAGAHEKHSNDLGLDCTVCHYNSKGSGPTHNDETVQAVTLGFYIFGSTVPTATYVKQTGVDYDTTVAGTTFNTSGTMMQCGNIYCHSTGQASGGGALTAVGYKTPVWSGTVECGDCHKSDGVQGNATAMDSGSHSKHIDASNMKTCSECHKNAGEGTAKHVNNLIEVSFNADPFSNSPSYSQSPNTPGNGYGSCSTVYCHSIGQKDGGAPLAAGSDYMNPTWGGAALCGSCHAVNMTTGSHTPHLIVSGYDCINCHNNAGSGTTKHTDRNIDIEFNAQAGVSGAYSQNPNPSGNGYGSCATTYCHGAASPTWGNNTATATCEKCHGSAATAAVGVFKDTSGSTTSGKAVSHVGHLASTHNLRNDIACNQCHAVPATASAAGHIDSALPAEVNPSLGFGGASCATSYCHGNAMPKGTIEGANRTPTWSDTGYLTGDPAHDCAQCHGYPPSAIAVHTDMGPTTCINCHNFGINAAGTGFTDPSLHVDGILQGGGDLCLDCHSSLSATHAKHADAPSILAGKSLSGDNYGEAWFYDVAWSSGAPKYSCGYCHPKTSATHMNGVKNLNFDPNEAGMPGGTVKALNGYPSYTQTPGVSVTCASVYCHSTGYNDGTGYTYQTTPNWYGGLFTGDKCSNCHGNSPNNGKSGSLSHYNPNAMGLTGVVGGHFVGIHYKNVFTGTTGLIKDADLRQNAHGDPLTSTTINCQTCHNVTVTASGNDLNAICATCHGAGALKGTMVIAPAATTHINGQADVSFDSSVVNSKAQVRDNITTVTELNNSWTRNNGYKAAASYDGAETSASYDAGTKSCSSVACHNGNAVQWGATNVTCNSCHTRLP